MAISVRASARSPFFARGLALVLLATAWLASGPAAQARGKAPPRPWSHIEYGAANYAGSPGADPAQQHVRLFATIEQLVARNGPRGKLYLNDLPAHLDGVLAAVQRFVTDRNWTELEVIPWEADFTKGPLPRTDTAHLSHPEPSLISADCIRRFAARAKVVVVTTHGVKQMTRALEELGTSLGHQDHGPAQPYVDHQGTAWRFEARVHVFSRRPQAVRKNPLVPRKR